MSVNTRVTKSNQEHFHSIIFCLLSSTTFRFIEKERRSYGGVKHRVVAIIFRMVDWLDPAVSRGVW